jgi:hypothetical protein
MASSRARARLRTLARPHWVRAACHPDGRAPFSGKAASDSQHSAIVSASSSRVRRSGEPILTCLRRERDLLSLKLSSIQNRCRYQATAWRALG